MLKIPSKAQLPLRLFATAMGAGLLMVAGVLVPLVMHSTLALAGTSILMLVIGLVAWVWLHGRWPEIGRLVAGGAA